MSKAIVGRPVNGITINGELEFLLDDNGEIKVFDSPEQARSFLISNGVDTEELRHMTIMESCGRNYGTTHDEENWCCDL